MPDRLHETEIRTGTVGSHAPAHSSAPLISLANAAWPSRLPHRDTAGLPPAVLQALPAGPYRSRLARSAASLDRSLPGWPERAAAALAQACGAGIPIARAAVGFGRPALSEAEVSLPPATPDRHLHRLAALLAHRPLRDPEQLLRAAASTANPDDRLWLLVALSGTDTPAVRAFWLSHLRNRVSSEPVPPDPALWFAFLHAFLHGWLTFPDFRDALASGRVLAAAHPKGRYPAALSQLGLSTHPTFSKWYRQVVYEVAHQPDVSLSLRDAGWIRDFPGEDYLFDALAQLQTKPDSWWPLHVLRWTSGLDPDDDRLVESLRDISPVALCLLSVLRSDLCPAVGRALGVPNHRAVVNWLKTVGPGAPLDPAWAQTALAEWVSLAGEPLVLAVGALCSLEPPEDVPASHDAVARRRAFVRAHHLPEFDRLAENLCYVHALRNQHFDLILEHARRGRPPAIRALALWPEKAGETASLLFRLSREASSVARRAALQSLDILKSHTGAADLQSLEKRVDLASAWSDAGLEGMPARVWWDVAGYRIKLSVAAGTVTLRAYSGSRPLATIPKSVRQSPQYAEIREARTALARGYRYFRRRFEEAMVEGVSYPGRDFAVLLANPMVRSLISRLMLLADGEPLHWTPPDPLDSSHHSAEIERAARVAIAHPLDLSEIDALPHWQQRVIDARIPQPFKQVFREVYLVAESERTATSCQRFSGYPLVARRAFALLRGRGYSPRHGDALKEWPLHNLRAHLQWARPEEDAGRLLAQTGLSDPVTSGPVLFETGAGRPVPLAEVPPVVFSETLRDADLLVSRATAGELGFTSEETRRLRSSLVRYLARALDLTNVYVGDKDLHVIVEGARALYRVHLGSGSVLLENTRRHLDLRSVTTEQVGELLAEGMDSLTARILGIIGALSRDGEITDPYFLRQLP